MGNSRFQPIKGIMRLARSLLPKARPRRRASDRPPQRIDPQFPEITPPNNLIAAGWKAFVITDASTGRIRIAIGHQEVNTYANIFYPPEALADGIEIDIGKMMDVALSITNET